MKETRSFRICLKLYSGRVVFVFANRSYFFVVPYNFCWIGVSSDIIIIVNYRQLSLNWTWNIHNRVCGTRISLCGLNLTSQNFVWNVFYTLAMRNAFSFHKLVNVHFWSTFWKFSYLVSYNFKIINGQNISSGEKTRNLDTRKTLSSSEK